VRQALTRPIYTPDAGFTGEDAFTHRAGDGEELSDVATVTIVVHAAADEHPPMAGDFNGDQAIDADDIDMLFAAIQTAAAPAAAQRRNNRRADRSRGAGLVFGDAVVFAFSCGRADFAGSCVGIFTTSRHASSLIAAGQSDGLMSEFADSGTVK
jgi:hypothetical protein